MATKGKSDKVEKRQMKAPYAQLREAAKQNAETKRSTGAVQVRVGLMLVGIIIAVIAYSFPNLSSFLNGEKIVDQCKKKKL